MKISRCLPALLLLPLTAPALADVDVFACEPEWAALAMEIGGDKVDTSSAVTPFQDPHFIQARPSLISRVRGAELIVCSGAGLEVGWLPVLLRSASNADVMPGTPGFLEAAQFVTRLEMPSSNDRASGDIHPYGNPHVQTDPRNILLVARELTERLVQLDPANADFYRQRAAAFEQRWQENIKRWDSEIAPLKGMPVVVHHRSWVYLENWLGLEEVAALEPKPGLPPTASHLAGLLKLLEREPAKYVIRAAYQSDQASNWLSDHADIRSVMIPQTVGASDAADTLEHWFDDIIRRLKEGQE